MSGVDDLAGMARPGEPGFRLGEYLLALGFSPDTLIRDIDAVDIEFAEMLRAEP